jgi:hypothetical protein
MLPIEAAAIWSLLGALLLLPSDLQLDAPLLPPLDKMAIASIATLILCLMKGTQVRPPRQSRLVYLFAAAFVIAPIFTTFGNSYELLTAKESIPGFYPLDGIKIAGRNLVMLAPFYIGSRFLYTEEGRALLLRAIPTATLFYSLPMLWEVRMSPQLHSQIYGYFPNDAFSQQIRGTGFRPVVFFPHGLALALFTSLALLASIVLVRRKTRIFHLPAIAVSAYLAALLVFCRSLGPALYAVVLSPVIMFLRPRAWVKIGLAGILVVCAYPVLRNNGLAPVQLVYDVAHTISPDRSKSFETRVTNEDQLLAKANQKPMFGWGTWGRNRIYDPSTGKDISITDGGWIIEYGTWGWSGYLALFGLLAACALRALRSVGEDTTPASITVGGLALLLSIYVVDQVPNANPLSLTFLIAGSIAASARARASKPARRSGARQISSDPMPVSG